MEDGQNQPVKPGQNSEDQIETLTQTEPKKSKIGLITSIIILVLIIIGLVGFTFYLNTQSKSDSKAKNSKTNKASQIDTKPKNNSQVLEDSKPKIQSNEVQKAEVQAPETDQTQQETATTPVIKNKDGSVRLTLDPKVFGTPITMIKAYFDDGDSYQNGKFELIGWYKDETQLPIMTACMGTCFTSPLYIKIFGQVNNSWQQIGEFTNNDVNAAIKQKGGAIPLIPPRTGYQMVNSPNANALIMPIQYAPDFGSRTSEGRILLALMKYQGKYKLIMPTDESLGKYSTSTTKDLSIKGDEIIDKRAIYKDSDSVMGPTGGTLTYTWKFEDGNFKLISTTTDSQKIENSFAKSRIPLPDISVMVSSAN